MYPNYPQFTGQQMMPTQYPNGYTANNFNIGNQYQQQVKMEVVRVNGLNGAQAYNMPPNSSILLLDTQAPVVYLKVTDGAGYPSITAYSISPMADELSQQTKMVDDGAYNNVIHQIEGLNERLCLIEAQLEGTHDAKPNPSGTIQQRRK